MDSSRRIFLQKAGVGLATIGASGLVLRSDAVPTQEVNRDQVVIQLAQVKSEAPAKTELKKVVSFPYGPFYKEGAPFRGKLSLPGSPERNSSYLAECGPSIPNNLSQVRCWTSGMLT
jgi:hypothetical protein